MFSRIPTHQPWGFLFLKLLINKKACFSINLDKKDVTMRDKKINLCIWDTAGQEKFFSLTKCEKNRNEKFNNLMILAYFQRADGVVIVFDITNEESFKSF